MPQEKSNPKPFPTMHAEPAAPAQAFRTYELPRQQTEFLDWARDQGLLRQGGRRWRNPSRNVVTLEFSTEQPRWIALERLHKEWPPFERRVIVKLAPGSTAELPELWTRGVVTVDASGFVVGGACPFLQPVGIPPFGQNPAFPAPEPFDGPEAA